jgi:hypothetical protein
VVLGVVVVLVVEDDYLTRLRVKGVKGKGRVERDIKGEEE